jgi:ribose/xylose/arabinose/galactoside ABC-type transport system permease subunit
MADTNTRRRGAFRTVDVGRYSIYIVTAVAFVFLALTRENFFRYANIYSLVFGLSMEFFLIVGITLLLIMGEIDLSIGSVFAFAGIFTGYLMWDLEFPIWLAVPSCLAVAAGIGFVNGFLVVRFRANSLMITIGTMILFRGFADVLINTLKGITYPSEYRAIANFRIGGVNFTIFLMLAVLVVLEYLLVNHASFRKLYYIGENRLSAKIYGVRVDRVKHTIFILTSVAAAIAGIFGASRSGQTVWNTGQGLEFKMITAAILGGASLFGGRGSIVKSLFGLFLLAIILNGLVMYSIDPVWTDVVVGIALVVAIVFDSRVNREKLAY